jgi:hypothetical protein
MVRFLLLPVFSLICLGITAQKTTPGNVVARFNSEYPDHTNEAWTSPSKDIYVVKFLEGDKSRSVKYDMEGKWWEKQFETTYDELTSAIKADISKSHSGMTIDSVGKYEKRDKTITYWVFFELPPRSTLNPDSFCRLLGINYYPDGKSGMIVHTNCNK